MVVKRIVFTKYNILLPVGLVQVCDGLHCYYNSIDLIWHFSLIMFPAAVVLRHDSNNIELFISKRQVYNNTSA